MSSQRSLEQRCNLPLPCLLKDSELEDNDWISLYLKLAVATTNKSFDVARLSLANLKILKVATESTQGLGDYDAVFYIEYEDSCEARVGKDVHRVAIVRRILDKQSEVLCLLGHNQSINNSAAMEAGSSSAQD
ncbi:BnaC07g33190D [Brassica napus]|uniref:BnaC07g33190D protein n=2 Tax=Brassica TaxID=3705 RepID=A0A078F9J0_BRANA|nr:BnaC07g33190D [Brassica napus]